jgi:hypothetical protein
MVSLPIVAPVFPLKAVSYQKILLIIDCVAVIDRPVLELERVIVTVLEFPFAQNLALYSVFGERIGAPYESWYAPCEREALPATQTTP